MAHEPDRFERSFTEWARRPPETSASDAAWQVRRRLANQGAARPSTRSWWVAAATAAAVLAVVMARWVPVTLPAPLDTLASNTPVAVPEGVALIWLDAETPLYMTFEPPTQPSSPLSAQPNEGTPNP